MGGMLDFTFLLGQVLGLPEDASGQSARAASPAWFSEPLSIASRFWEK
jgi:hypothetical protein